MSRLPGQRLHSLSEMQMMGQSAQQKAIGRVAVLEQTMGAMQRKQQEADANLLRIIDTLTMQQQALDQVIKRVEKLLSGELRAMIDEVATKPKPVTLGDEPPKRKPGRPKGSKNKPKAAPEAETVSAAPETASGEAAE